MEIDSGSQIPIYQASSQIVNYDYHNSQKEWLWKKRYVQDNVYNQIELSQYYWRFIDTPQFQRLADIKQLGNLYYVFPGAVHSRFTHSLGVASVAQEEMEHLLQTSKDDREFRKQVVPLDISEQDIKNVVLAGLMHDLGHGTCSHLFDRDLMPRLLKPHGIEWQHEDASVMLLKHMIDENNIDFIEKEDINKVSNLIKGDPPSYSNDKRWMFDIVANKTNSLDVDKFDYLQRDCKTLGLKQSCFDYKRLIRFSRVIDNQLCYNQKVYHEITQVYKTRYMLFKDVYTHRVCRAIDSMIVDALLLANPVFKFADNIYNPEAYQNYTDSLLGFIERSKDPALKASQDILLRLRKRDIYRFLDQKLLIDQSLQKYVTEQEIVNHQDVSKFNVNLRPEDVIVTHHSLDWGKGDQNPLNSVPFYNSEYDLTKFYKTRQEVGLCYPKVYQEFYLRVFVKDENKYEAARYAFNKLCSKYQDQMGGDDKESPLKQRLYSSQKKLNSNLNSQNSNHKRANEDPVDALERKTRYYSQLDDLIYSQDGEKRFKLEK